MLHSMVMNELDRTTCYRALQTHDSRFDGRFFTAVKTTGIYCRPICPARVPRIENCTFYATAAAAQGAGYRSCLRCRPELSPDLAVWRGSSDIVTRALALIADGVLDTSSVEDLAKQLGLGTRQLRRLFTAHVGVSPIEVAQTRRLLFAKQLINDTDLPMVQVAMLAGFNSLRRFNDAFLGLYRRSPRELRRRASAGAAGVCIFLPYRPPYDWAAMLDHLERRAIDGVETVATGCYRRTLNCASHVGIVEVAPAPRRDGLEVTLSNADPRALPVVVRQVRRLFDLAADIATITEQLAATDPLLARLVETRPGLRVPGGWDTFELAIRAVLGQQVTLEAARRLATKLVKTFGTKLPNSSNVRLTHLFPTPEQLACADVTVIGMPRARARTISALAEAVVVNPELLRPGHSLEDSLTRLRAILGVGDWTAQYIALRALGETDAFPASDVGLLRAFQDSHGQRPSPAEISARAEAWRPWRAYAAQHLWAAGVGGALTESKTAA